MKIMVIGSLKLILLMSVTFSSNIFSQDLEGRIATLLNQMYGSNLLLDGYNEIDSIKNNYIEYKIDNTIEQLNGYVIFFSRNSETNDRYVGIYSENTILWLSDPIGDVYFGNIMALRDINDDDKIEIITSWTRGEWEYIWIFQWNGNTGIRINDADISAHIGTIVLKDVNGDGLDEFIGKVYYMDPDTETEKVENYVYSWNGLEYGSWANTPEVDLESYTQADGIIASVRVNIEESDDSLQYTYSIENSAASSQSIKYFYFTTSIRIAEIVSKEPTGWVPNELNSNLLNFRTYFEQFEIPPGESLTDFTILSDGIPSISTYYIQADHIYPEINRTIESDINDIITNSFSSVTLVPEYPEYPMVPDEFIQILINSTTRSYDLGWIKAEQSKTKYENFFLYAKDALVNSDTSSARRYLENVLIDVDVDSSSTLSSEAYALLRYNTEYLLEQLPVDEGLKIESISPTITKTKTKDFTLTVYGSNFTKKSDVYFKGKKKKTKFISENVLEAKIKDKDIKKEGTYTVHVSEKKVGRTAELEFNVYKKLPEKLIPVLNCIEELDKKKSLAWFGYENYNDGIVLLEGKENEIKGEKKKSGEPPVIFLPGIHEKVFSVEYDGKKKLKWELQKEKAEVKEDSRLCQ